MKSHRVINTSPKNEEPPMLPLHNEKKEVFFEKRSHSDLKKEQEEALNKLVKECVKEWCENTTSHGFSNIVKTDSWLIRITWIILVVLFMGYCIYSVVIVIVAYAQYETNINYQVVSDAPPEFPAITICNLNPFDVASNNNTGDYIKYILKANNISPKISINNSDEYGITLVEDAASILKAAVAADKSLNTSTLQKLGFTMDTMMISCFYNNEKCNETDFFWFRDPEYGNCYTFNSLFDSNDQLVDSKKTSKTGPINGLNLELFVGAAGSQDFYTIKRGVKVVVHQRGMKPLLKYQGINVATALASNIAITRTNYSKLEAPYSDCRSDTNTILKTDSEYYKNTLKISKYYRRLCYEICMQYSQIIPNCSCADPSIPSVDSNQTTCTNKTGLACVKAQRDYFDKQNIDEICGDDCPLECETMVYSTSLSLAKYPTNYYAGLLMDQNNLVKKFNPSTSFDPSKSVDQNPMGPPIRKKRQNLLNSGPNPNLNGANGITTNLNNSTNNTNNNTALLNNINNNNVTALNNTNSNINKNNTSFPGFGNNNQLLGNNIGGLNPMFNRPDFSALDNSVLMVSIFYEDLRYTFIQETPAITFETLMGVIGGQFGLFMGASFLSFVELLEMGITLVRIIFKYRNERKLVKIATTAKFNNKV